MTASAPALACAKCRVPLTKPATGRPPRWCSTSCRRSAENEIRRLTNQLSTHETRRDALTLELALHAGGQSRYGGTGFIPRTNIELEHHAERITFYEARLRDLYAALENEGDGIPAD